jgi:hypothetical protein
MSKRIMPVLRRRVDYLRGKWAGNHVLAIRYKPPDAVVDLTP